MPNVGLIGADLGISVKQLANLLHRMPAGRRGRGSAETIGLVGEVDQFLDHAVVPVVEFSSQLIRHALLMGRDVIRPRSVQVHPLPGDSYRFSHPLLQLRIRGSKIGSARGPRPDAGRSELVTSRRICESTESLSVSAVTGRGDAGRRG